MQIQHTISRSQSTNGYTYSSMALAARLPKSTPTAKAPLTTASTLATMGWVAKAVSLSISIWFNESRQLYEPTCGR